MPHSAITSLKTVFSVKAYAALFLIFAVAFYALFFFLAALPGQSFESFWYSMTNLTRAFFVLVPALLGLVFMFQAYAIKRFGIARLSGKTAVGSSGSLVLGVLAVSCCSPLIAGALGIGAFSFFVAVHQPYFLALALLVLLASLYYSSRVVHCESCHVKLG